MIYDRQRLWKAKNWRNAIWNFHKILLNYHNIQVYEAQRFILKMQEITNLFTFQALIWLIRLPDDTSTEGFLPPTFSKCAQLLFLFVTESMTVFDVRVLNGQLAQKLNHSIPIADASNVRDSRLWQRTHVLKNLKN